MTEERGKKRPPLNKALKTPKAEPLSWPKGKGRPESPASTVGAKHWPPKPGRLT